MLSLWHGGLLGLLLGVDLSRLRGVGVRLLDLGCLLEYLLLGRQWLGRALRSRGLQLGRCLWGVLGRGLLWP